MRALAVAIAAMAGAVSCGQPGRAVEATYFGRVVSQEGRHFAELEADSWGEPFHYALYEAMSRPSMVWPPVTVTDVAAEGRAVIHADAARLVGQGAAIDGIGAPMRDVLVCDRTPWLVVVLDPVVEAARPAVALLDAEGRVRWQHSVDELFPRALSFEYSTAGTHWYERSTLDEERQRIVVHALGGVARVVSLESGDLDPP